MKLIPTLALASLLASAAAFAADPPPPPASSPPAATPAKKSLKDCRAEASAKKLEGEERKKFITDCRAGT